MSNQKTTLNKKELKEFKKKSFVSIQKQMAYFKTLKGECLIKHYLSFHQFKKLGLYDSLKNHKSNHPDNFVKGSKGYVLFKVNSDYSLRVMDWKDKRALSNTLKRNDQKALTQYANSIKTEQLRLLHKIEKQFKKGNYTTLAIENNGSYSNRELNRYLFTDILNKYDKSVLSVFKCYSYLFKNGQDFIKTQSERNKISLVSEKESVNYTTFIHELKRATGISL